MTATTLPVSAVSDALRNEDIACARVTCWLAPLLFICHVAA